MTSGVDRWGVRAARFAEPTYSPVVIEPSPEGADDIARLLSISAFNGICWLITALARRGLLSYAELDGLHDAISFPLDDPEMRDDEVISAFCVTLQDVLAHANGKQFS